MTVETESFSHNIINIFFNVLAYVLRVEKRDHHQSAFISNVVYLMLTKKSMSVNTIVNIYIPPQTTKIKASLPSGAIFPKQKKTFLCVGHQDYPSSSSSFSSFSSSPFLQILSSPRSYPDPMNIPLNVMNERIA